MKKVWKLFMTVSLMALTMLFVSACSDGGGGGGTSTTLKGTAAAGAPIIGQVFVKDSKGFEAPPVLIDANGNYSIDVSGMTGPFKLKAVSKVGNTDVTYCSLATADDLGKTINITPFTDLLVASIAGQAATNFYSDGDPAKITSDLAPQVEALTKALTPVLQSMGLASAMDLLRTSFTIGDKVDTVMDITKVTVDPATAAVTIKSLIDESKVISGTAGGTLTGKENFPVATTTQLTDIEKIRDGITAFTSKFATSMPSPTDPALLALFDVNNFMDKGRNLDNFLYGITQDGSVIGMTASTPTFIEFDPATGKALVEFTVTPKNSSSTEVIRWRFHKTNGVWYAQGDGLILDIEIVATAYKMQATTQQNPSVKGTGIALHVEDKSNTSVVHHVTVAGPGLSGGVTLYNQKSNVNSPSDQFTIDQTGMNMNNVYWLATDTAAHDSAILAAFPAGSDSNIPYTVTLFDANNAQKAQYTIMMTKRPYTYAELSTAPFATLVNPATLADLAGFQLNVAQTISWTLAAGTTSDWLQVQVWGAANGEYIIEDVDLTDAQTSATATLSGSFTPAKGSVWLTVSDADKRMLSTSINGN